MSHVVYDKPQNSCHDKQDYITAAPCFTLNMFLVICIAILILLIIVIKIIVIRWNSVVFGMIVSSVLLSGKFVFNVMFVDVTKNS